MDYFFDWRRPSNKPLVLAISLMTRLALNPTLQALQTFTHAHSQVRMTQYYSENMMWDHGSSRLP